MAVINLEVIQSQLPEGWKVVSDTYKNLDQELRFLCPVGHDVYSSWKKMRVRAECPICKEKLVLAEQKIIPKEKGVIRTIAIDQATHVSGFAVYDNLKLVRYGTFNSTKTKEIERDNEIKMWVCSLITNWQPDLVALEGIQFQENVSGHSMGVTTFETLARLQGILMEACFEYKTPFIICATNTWRAHCGVKGRSRADKKASMRALAKQWHEVIVSDDEADAIGIGRYAADMHGAKFSVQNWE